MPRVPVHREPKPHPRRSRSHDRRSGHHSPSHSGSGFNGIPAPEPKKRISTLTGHLVAASGEFCGTFMFLYFSFACQLMLVNQAGERGLVNQGASSQQNVFTALVYGFSLLVNVWAFFRISGGLFNPAVCLMSSSYGSSKV